MSQHRRRSLLAALCASAVVGLAACSPTATSAPSASASAPATHAAPLTTGKTLKSLLLPASAVPSSLKLDPSGSRDTGTAFNPPQTTTVSKAKACDALNGISWVDATGIGSGSFAQNDYTDSSGDMFAQEIDAFRGKDANTVMSRVKNIFAECATFPVKVGGHSYAEHLTSKPLPGVGDDAVRATFTSPDLDGGVTLVAVRVGNRVVTTLDNDLKGTGSGGVALTKQLAARLH